VPRELPAFDDVEPAGFRFDGNATETMGGRRESPQLDALAGSWSKALESARSALRAAGPYLSGKELGERSSRLAEERSNVAQLLEGLARDLQAHTGYTWLAAPTSL
jgi:hypothetical protein